MKLNDELSQVSTHLDLELRDDRYGHVFIRDSRYVPWYSKLLTTLTLVVGTDEVEYTQASHDEAAGAARFVVVTATTVIVVDALNIGEDETEEPDVATKIVARASLESLEVSASMPIDIEGSRALAWPGEVSIAARYRGLDGPVGIHGPGALPRQPDEPSPVLRLLSGLKTDWTGHAR